VQPALEIMLPMMKDMGIEVNDDLLIEMMPSVAKAVTTRPRSGQGVRAEGADDEGLRPEDEPLHHGQGDGHDDGHGFPAPAHHPGHDEGDAEGVVAEVTKRQGDQVTGF
jgi:hypothetical protein